MTIIPPWLEGWLQQYSLLDGAVTVIALVTAGTLLWRTLKRWWPGLLVFIEFVKALGRLPEFMRSAESTMATQSETLASQSSTLAEHGKMLATVKHEVLPNHGGSLRDEVVTLRLQQDQTKAKLTKDHERFNIIEHILKIRERQRIDSQANSEDYASSFDSGSIHTYPVHDQKED